MYIGRNTVRITTFHVISELSSPLNFFCRSLAAYFFLRSTTHSKSLSTPDERKWLRCSDLHSWHVNACMSWFVGNNALETFYNSQSVDNYSYLYKAVVLPSAEAPAPEARRCWAATRGPGRWPCRSRRPPRTPTPLQGSNGARWWLCCGRPEPTLASYLRSHRGKLRGDLFYSDERKTCD